MITLILVISVTLHATHKEKPLDKWYKNYIDF